MSETPHDPPEPEPSAETTPDSARLWRFAIDLYGRDGVEDAALALQDDHGLDVTMLLLCCFLGRHGVRARRETIAALDQHARAWRAVAVEPLRALRRRLKRDVGAVSAESAAPFRERVKALELEAERLALDTLFRTLERLPGRDAREAERAGVMRVNLSLYVEQAGVTDRASARPHLEALVLGAVETVLKPAPERAESAEGDANDA